MLFVSGINKQKEYCLSLDYLVIITGTFFLGGLFLNLVTITARFFPRGAVFESGQKCLEPVLFPGVPFLVR